MAEGDLRAAAIIAPLLLGACSTLVYRDGDITITRERELTFEHVNSLIITVENKGKGTKTTLKLEGGESNQVQGLKEAVQGAVEGAMTAIKP